MKKKTISTLLFFLMFNFITTGGHFDSHDGIFYYLVAENIALNQSMMIDPNSPSVTTLEFSLIIENFVRFWVPEIYNEYLDGKKTSFFLPGSVGGPLLAVPFYILALITDTEPVNVVPFFVNSIIIALTSLIIFLIVNQIFKSAKIGFVIALIFNSATFIWPYNTSFFLQPALALILTTSVYFLTKDDRNLRQRDCVLSGLFLGMSILIHPSATILIPGFLLYGIIKSKTREKVGVFIIGFISIATIQVVVNYLKYDDPMNFGYNTIGVISEHSNWEGILGLLFSPGWGIVFYFPLIILVPLSLYRIYQDNKILLFLIIYSFVASWLFFGTLVTPHWSGFGAWGPRYFIPILPLLVISLGYFLAYMNKNHKIIFITLAIIGFFINLLGKLVWYMTGYSYGWGIERLLEKPDSFNYFAWVPYYSPILQHLKVLLSDYGFQIMNPITKQPGCYIDVYVNCIGGVIVSLVMLGIIFVFGIFIWKKILVVKVSN